MPLRKLVSNPRINNQYFGNHKRDLLTGLFFYCIMDFYYGECDDSG